MTEALSDTEKVWKHGIKIREDLDKLRVDAQDAHEHELSGACSRALSELNHPSFTGYEHRAP